MKKIQFGTLALVLLAGLTPWAAAQKAPEGDKPGAIVTELVEWSGTVIAVDRDQKTVMLRGPVGRVITVKAKNPRNLDLVEVGANVRYRLTIYVRQCDGAPQAVETQSVQFVRKGQKQSAVVVNTTEVTADVEDINYPTRVIALKIPKGFWAPVKPFLAAYEDLASPTFEVQIFTMSGAVERLPEIKVGDPVFVRVTEEIALEDRQALRVGPPNGLR
jgi:hypothetical protein